MTEEFFYMNWISETKSPGRATVAGQGTAQDYLQETVKAKLYGIFCYEIYFF